MMPGTDSCKSGPIFTSVRAHRETLSRHLGGENPWKMGHFGTFWDISTASMLAVGEWHRGVLGDVRCEIPLKV